MDLEDVLVNLKNVRRCGKGWSAQCPVHDDHRNSLSVSRGGNGKILLYCHAGCSVESIFIVIRGSPINEGFNKVANWRPDHEAVAIYSYKDEQEITLYEILRFDPKDFRPRVRDGSGGYRRGLPSNLRRILYRLPELLASNPDEIVFIVEGEKDVEALRKRGLIATCNVGGAGKWRDEYNESLRNRHVCIVPDNDRPGLDHANKVAETLYPVVASVRIVRLFDVAP